MAAVALTVALALAVVLTLPRAARAQLGSFPPPPAPAGRVQHGYAPQTREAFDFRKLLKDHVAVGDEFSSEYSYQSRVLSAVRACDSARALGNAVDNGHLCGARGAFLFGNFLLVAAETSRRLTVLDVYRPSHINVVGSVHDEDAMPNPLAVWGLGVIGTSGYTPDLLNDGDAGGGVGPEMAPPPPPTPGVILSPTTIHAAAYAVVLSRGEAPDRSAVLAVVDVSYPGRWRVNEQGVWTVFPEVISTLHDCGFSPDPTFGYRRQGYMCGAKAFAIDETVYVKGTEPIVQSSSPNDPFGFFGGDGGAGDGGGIADDDQNRPPPETYPLALVVSEDVHAVVAISLANVYAPRIVSGISDASWLYRAYSVAVSQAPPVGADRVAFIGARSPRCATPTCLLRLRYTDPENMLIIGTSEPVADPTRGYPYPVVGAEQLARHVRRMPREDVVGDPDPNPEGSDGDTYPYAFVTDSAEGAVYCVSRQCVRTALAGGRGVRECVSADGQAPVV
ncbi:hypothetical protein RI054_31g124710 [Pseudoscourfieldia marina]